MAKKAVTPEASDEDPDFPKNLKHYTTLDSLISILSKTELHLGYSDKWEDKNDIASLQGYTRHLQKKDPSLEPNSVQVKILCFAYGVETIHHWKTFAKGSVGCRIDFKNGLLEKKLESIPDIIYKKVEYVSRTYDLSQYTKKDYPFLKRIPYECENEFRIVWAGKGEAPVIPIKGLISRITISPHVDDRAVAPIRKLLKDNYGIEEVYKSRILDYDKWTKLFQGDKH